jgi:hypothetical protein
MCAEASTVLRAVAADFFFNCWYLEIPSDNRIRHVPRYVRKAFDWKGSRISMLEVEAVPWSFVPFIEKPLPSNDTEGYGYTQTKRRNL